MANFIAYSDDKKRIEQMKIIMDILWLDVALNSINNRFAEDVLITFVEGQETVIGPNDLAAVGTEYHNRKRCVQHTAAAHRIGSAGDSFQVLRHTAAAAAGTETVEEIQDQHHCPFRGSQYRIEEQRCHSEQHKTDETGSEIGIQQF